MRVAGYARCVGLLFSTARVCKKIKQNRQNASCLAKKSPAALRMSHPNRHYHPRQPLRRVAAQGVGDRPAWGLAGGRQGVPDESHRMMSSKTFFCLRDQIMNVPRPSES